jgi:hypothetical protein
MCSVVSTLKQLAFGQADFCCQFGDGDSYCVEKSCLLPLCPLSVPGKHATGARDASRSLVIGLTVGPL